MIILGLFVLIIKMNLFSMNVKPMKDNTHTVQFRVNNFYFRNLNQNFQIFNFLEFLGNYIIKLIRCPEDITCISLLNKL